MALGAGVVEAVFVEGDVQRLEFRAADGLQTIVFRQGGRWAELSYRPGQGSLLWSGPEAVSGFRFAEKIFVHGDIWSIVQAGKAAFADESRIQILASGQMRVETGLRGENLELQKARFAHLLLMTSGKDFFGDDESMPISSWSGGGQRQYPGGPYRGRRQCRARRGAAETQRLPDRQRYPEFGAPAGRCPGGAVRFYGSLEIAKFSLPAEFPDPIHYGEQR